MQVVSDMEIANIRASRNATGCPRGLIQVQDPILDRSN